MKGKAEKKTITLEKYHETKLLCSACWFALTLILIISNEILKTDTPFWLLVPAAVLIVLTAVSLVPIICWKVSKRVEKHDELSLRLLTKAHSQIFVGFSVLVIASLVVSKFWTEPVQINLDGNLLFIIAMGLYSLLNACESGFFLANEKRLSSESECGDE